MLDMVIFSAFWIEGLQVNGACWAAARSMALP